MYCHYFHVVLSDGDFFFARMIFHVHVSSLTWWPCLPISFLFFIGTCSTFLGMCACIQLSLVGLLVMSSRHLCDMSWLEVLLIILLYSEILILIRKYRPYEHRVPPQQPGLPLALCTAVATTYGSASVGALQNTSLQYFVCFEFILYHWKPLQSIINACLEWFVPCFFAFYFWILLSLLY